MLPLGAVCKRSSQAIITPTVMVGAAMLAAVGNFDTLDIVV